jgi:CIC family chloride channel protein
LDSVSVAYDDEPMWLALRRLGIRDIGRLPVVKRGTEDQLVGVVRRKDIIQAYNMAIIKRAQHQHRADIEVLGKLIDSQFIHIQVPPDAAVVDQRISDINLPEESLIVSIHRGRKLYIPHGYTTIQAGDHLTVFARDESIAEAQNRLTLPPEPEESEDEEEITNVN